MIRLTKHHQHGGQLKAASEQYHIPPGDWLDLSTGISPFVYPLPNVPRHCWQRLPEENDGLELAAADYYGSEYLLAVAGSQEAIQRLPFVTGINQQKPQAVGIISPAYHSHKQAWESANHKVLEINANQINNKLAELDVLVVVNPTNPTAQTFRRETLLGWHRNLASRGGCLIVDEAFMDATPDNTLISQTPPQGLIVLRSIGKFFGLAGIRLGFVWAETALLQSLAGRQDDWSVSHPARWAGKLALADKDWHKTQRDRLPVLSVRLAALLKRTLTNKLNTTVESSALFCYLHHDHATEVYRQLAQQGVLVRLFESPRALRFGLPADEKQWQTLETALLKISLNA